MGTHKTKIHWGLPGQFRNTGCLSENDQVQLRQLFEYVVQQFENGGCDREKDGDEEVCAGESEI